MKPQSCPREEGFRYFLHTLGRRFANPYPRGHESHGLFEAGWRQAARVCGQGHLAELSLGDVAENLPVRSRRHAAVPPVPVHAELPPLRPAPPRAASASSS